MPSRLHQTLSELFLNHPPLAAELLSDAFGMELPVWNQARIESAQVAEVPAAEWRGDALVTLVDINDAVVLAVVVEVQLRTDDDKRFSWPVYVSNIRYRRRCPTLVLVVCPDEDTAGWAAEPIVLGPGSVTTPLALGAQLVPVVTDPVQAAICPERAVLSALAHGVKHRHWRQVVEAAWTALQAVDQDHFDLYADMVHAALSGASRRYLEELMNVTVSEPLSPLFRPHWVRGRAEGRAEAGARAVLAVLAARGIEVPDIAMQRITTCTDLDQLDAWVRRAVAVSSAQELFAEPTASIKK